MTHESMIGAESALLGKDGTVRGPVMISWSALPMFSMGAKTRRRRRKRRREIDFCASKIKIPTSYYLLIGSLGRLLDPS